MESLALTGLLVLQPFASLVESLALTGLLALWPGVGRGVSEGASLVAVAGFA